MFPYPAVTIAAIDRLVQHANIIEINTDCYRHRAAAENAAARKGRAEPANLAKPRAKAGP